MRVGCLAVAVGLSGAWSGRFPHRGFATAARVLGEAAATAMNLADQLRRARDAAQDVCGC
ncbi:hypothetical protein [Streptomyces sp. NWU339]|uniref:hypothetical protein n=1 Tax=Streptomyces sp. NWU339 TaxID=2185284 RepID=UPI0011B3C2AD|nr:hypothetical protein [Streptomyces sp. NWU339]